MSPELPDWRSECPECGATIVDRDVQWEDPISPAQTAGEFVDRLRASEITLFCRNGHDFCVHCAEWSHEHGYRYQPLGTT